MFHPDVTLWKERFYQNVPSFKLRSQNAAAALRKAAGMVDAVFQIGVLWDTLWDDPSIPSVIYTDYTSTLASRKPEWGRSPLSPADLSVWLGMEKKAYQRSAHICTRGQYVRQSVIADYGIPDSKVTAIGGGVNFDTLPEITSKMEAKSPTALFIGKDFFRKGGDTLLKAFKVVRESVPDARLIMVTSGIPRVDYDLTGVELVEPTWDRERICDLYRQADCFVLPSRLETWGDVILEAMAFGLPCIGVSGEAMSEIIEDGKTGLIVPVDDQKALENALRHLLSNREFRNQCSSAARERVEEMYTWEMVSKTLVPIVESAIHS
jgi:glycosyltransferase involved in cell wall biosynthesis